MINWKLRSWMHFAGGFLCVFFAILLWTAWIAILPTVVFLFYEFYQDFCCRKERREDSYSDIAEWMFAMFPGIIAGAVVKILGTG